MQLFQFQLDTSAIFYSQTCGHTCIFTLNYKYVQLQPACFGINCMMTNPLKSFICLLQDLDYCHECLTEQVHSHQHPAILGRLGIHQSNMYLQKVKVQPMFCVQLQCENPDTMSGLDTGRVQLSLTTTVSLQNELKGYRPP